MNALAALAKAPLWASSGYTLELEDRTLAAPRSAASSIQSRRSGFQVKRGPRFQALSHLGQPCGISAIWAACPTVHKIADGLAVESYESSGHALIIQDVPIYAGVNAKLISPLKAHSATTEG